MPSEDTVAKGLGVAENALQVVLQAKLIYDSCFQFTRLTTDLDHRVASDLPIWFQLTPAIACL